MAIPTLTPDPSAAGALAPQPTQAGWYLVEFLDGSYGAARWDAGAGGWQWGSLSKQAPPESQIIRLSFLGATVKSFTQDIAGIGRWTSAIASLPAVAQATMIAVLDHGILGLKGEPVLFTGSNKAVGNSGKTSSEAVFSPIVPTPGSIGISTPSFLGVLGNLQFWKGIGLVLAGALILVVAGMELRKL